MAFIQVCRWSAHAAVEAVQDERTSGVGPFETPGARTAVGCRGRDANREVIGRGSGPYTCCPKVSVWSEPSGRSVRVSGRGGTPLRSGASRSDVFVDLATFRRKIARPK